MPRAISRAFWNWAAEMLWPLFQPDLTPAYLLALAGPVAETLGLTLAAMALAFPGGVLLGLVAVLGGRPGKALASFFTVFRAIPELTLAILCVVFFGLGPGAALVALALYYLASTGKIFADLFAAAPAAPLAALRRTGTGKTPLALWFYLPAAGPQLLAYGAFAFECAVRAAVVVGAVGGGGIGGELVGSLAAFDLPRASTCIIVTVLLIVLLDRVADWLRANPRWLWPLLLAGLVIAIQLWPGLINPRHAAGVLAEMATPHLPPNAWAALPRLIGETLAMGAGATILAALVALPIAFAASALSAPGWLRGATRLAAAALRAVPEIIWGIVLILWLGVGPLAGGSALFLHSLGSFIRLFADSLDATPAASRIAILRTGAGRPIATLYAALPQAADALLAHILFRLDWNLRMATVLGLIGAGGIGQALYEAQQLMHYDQMSAWILITAGLLLTVERLVASLRASRGDHRRMRREPLGLWPRKKGRGLAEESGGRTHPRLADSLTRI